MKCLLYHTEQQPALALVGHCLLEGGGWGGQKKREEGTGRGMMKAGRGTLFYLPSATN
jgi:hypothetical protein